MAAIREFFDLSPLWMKAAVGFVSVFFCVVTVLAVARFFDRAELAQAPGKKLYTETELKAKIEEAVMKQQNKDAQRTEAPTNQVVNNSDQRVPNKTVAGRSSTVAADGNKVRQRPLSKAEREQLAADLRLISPDDETDFELLGDRINHSP